MVHVNHGQASHCVIVLIQMILIRAAGSAGCVQICQQHHPKGTAKIPLVSEGAQVRALTSNQHTTIQTLPHANHATATVMMAGTHMIAMVVQMVFALTGHQKQVAHQMQHGLWANGIHLMKQQQVASGTFPIAQKGRAAHQSLLGLM